MPAFQDPDVYRDILDSLQIGVSVLDLQTKIVFWNDGAAHITGYERLDVLGHLCTDNVLQHCNQQCCDMCAERCPISSVLHGGKALEATSFIHHKSGHRAPVHIWAIPLRDKHGSIIGLILTFEGEVEFNGPQPDDQRTKERGWLDLLTGLPNQAMMQSHLRETMGTFADLHVPFAVVVVEFRELSGFRARYGQEAATSMLKVLARTLRNSVWPTDFVGRWSENRFLVILCGCGEEALQAVVSRMHRMMSNANILWWGEELTLKTSAGYAGAIVGETVETLIQRAECAVGACDAESSAKAVSAGGPSTK
jgi:diguanylate cyclase (GGDEF)-like protein/PAS domain S-box-containing protein